MVVTRRIHYAAALALAVLTCHACTGRPEQERDVTTLRYGTFADPATLDPAHSTDTGSGIVVLKVFDGLVQFEPETMEIAPDIAESYDVSADGTTYTFRLRKGVLFHNGREVTAEDFRYSLERILDPKTRSERRWVLAEIDGAEEFSKDEADSVRGIEVLDKYVLRIRLRRPLGPFLAQLCMEAASAVPREEVERWGENFTSHPVGCGPYKFVSWKHDVDLVLEAFDRYYGGSPKIPRIRIRILPDLNVMLEEYLAGGLDFVDELPPGRVKGLREQRPDELKIWPILATYYCGFNHQKPPFKGNLKLRQAFNYAIDRQGICEGIREGIPIPASGILPPGIPGHNPDLKVYDYAPEKAKRLLAEAGYPNGEGLPEIALWYNTQIGHKRICEYIQHCLRQIGVQIKLKNLDTAAYWLAMYDGEPAFFRNGWIADIPDPDNFLYTLLHSSQFGAAGNTSRYSNPKLDELVERARLLTDWSEREPLYREAERIAVEDAVWLSIYYYRDQALVKPYVKGIRYSVQGDFAIPWHEAYIESGE